MPQKTPWIERRFTFDMSLSMFPNVLERLRGTPARVQDRVGGLAPDQLQKLFFHHQIRLLMPHFQI